MKREIGVTRTKGVQWDSSVSGISDGSGASPEQSRMEAGLLCTGHENGPGEQGWGVHMRESLLFHSHYCGHGDGVTWSLSTQDLRLVSYLPIHTLEQGCCLTSM